MRKQHQVVTLYHGGICKQLPTPGILDFSTDRELAEGRAQAWGENGIVLEVQIELEGRKSIDRRFTYFPNMPMMRPGHMQYRYQVGNLKECTIAKREAVERTGHLYTT